MQADFGQIAYKHAKKGQITQKPPQFWATLILVVLMRYILSIVVDYDAVAGESQFLGEPAGQGLFRQAVLGWA